MEKIVEKVRLDKFLWSIRLFKTRGNACDACDKGRVKLESISLKPARIVKVGDVYEVRTDIKKWTIKVIKLIDKRVQYSEAILHYEDLTPPEELDRIKQQAAAFYTGKRLSKQGRPTKKDNRDITEFLDPEAEEN